jgi:two-component system, LytTR family, response regulator
MKAIIIDDEESARLVLRSLLVVFFKEVDIIGEADNPSNAVELIRATNPDLVFLDIHMGAQSGLDLLASIGSRNFQVIIISAHKDHAFDSFRFNVTDYLLKPLRISDLRAALEKVADNIKPAIEAKGLESENEEMELESKALLRPISQDQFRQQLIVPELMGFSVVKLGDIIRCEGAGNYTNFHIVKEKLVVASRPIGDFEELLTANGFLRVHKSHLINIYHLAKYIRGRGGDLIMTDGTQIPLARDRKDALLAAFIR